MNNKKVEYLFLSLPYIFIMRTYSSSGFRHLTPILIILLALLFLLQAMNMLSGAVVAVVWPILLGLIGIVKLEEAK